MQWGGVQLPASLPPLTFMCAEIWHPERVGAMAIYCSDGRWGDAFDEFCHRSLNIPRYDRFAVPGGPGWLTARSAAEPAVRQAARAQLEYLVTTHELDRLVLITHFGCGFYAEKLNVSADAAMPAQLEDMRAAARVLREWFDGIAVDEYLAMRAGHCLSFHRVEG